jgi:GDPmannose 4,6-dehydratase
MWMMMQHETPDDYVLATGETHSVREFVEETARNFGYTIEWKGSGLQEQGINTSTGEVVVEIDEKYFRPAEVDILLGDASKAKSVLGWEPKVTFTELVKIMCEDDGTESS